MWGGLKMNKGLLFLCLLLSLSFSFVETVDAVVAVVEDEDILNSDNGIWNAGFSITSPIFNQGKLRSNIKLNKVI